VDLDNRVIAAYDTSRRKNGPGQGDATEDDDEEGDIRRSGSRGHGALRYVDP